MGFYEYKKWFFDLFPEGGEEYLIMFVSQVKMGRIRRIYFQMHGAKRGQDSIFRPSLKCIKTFHPKESDSKHLLLEEGEILIENGNCKLDLEMASYRIRLKYESSRIEWPASFSHLDFKRKAYIDWIPKVLGGKVTGSVDSPLGTMLCDKTPGYSEEIISNFIPWRISISHLYSGRINHENFNLSFSIMKDRKTFSDVSRLFLEVEGKHFVLDGLFFNIADRKRSKSMNITYAEKYLIRGKSPEVEIKLEVSGHEEMILNDFMDYINEYGPFVTTLLRKISRDPLDIKFRASANVSIKTNETFLNIEKVFIVDEFVKFGS